METSIARTERRDALIAELSRYFRDSSLMCELTITLAGLPWTADMERIDAALFDGEEVARHRSIRRRLASLDQPHADVLAAMFTERVWPARVTSLFTWPGVAVHTVAAQWALAVAGQETFSVSRRNRPSRREPGVMRSKRRPEGRIRCESTITVPTGDFHRGQRPRTEAQAIMAYLCGLTARQQVTQAIRDEMHERVSRALAAYEAATHREKAR